MALNMACESCSVVIEVSQRSLIGRGGDAGARNCGYVCLLPPRDEVVYSAQWLCLSTPARALGQQLREAFK